MRVITGLHALTVLPRRSVVTIGMFDGVHLGHQRLINTAVTLAKRSRAASVVVTFHPDPQQILDPAHAPRSMMPLEDRVRLISALGVDLVWVIPFTPAFSKRSAERFVEEILVERLHAVCVVVGTTFMFGNERRGTLKLLQGLGRQYRMRVLVVAPVRRGGELVSSSRIRRLIESGELEEAHRLLGRPVELRGTVVKGEGRAQTLGFPTANVRLASTMLPPRGVYQIQLQHAEKRFRGLMNLGIRPTFLPAVSHERRTRVPPLVCEAHLVGFHGDLYGQSITIAVLKRLRDERQFDTPQALVQQIQRDLQKIC